MVIRSLGIVMNNYVVNSQICGIMELMIWSEQYLELCRGNANVNHRNHCYIIYIMLNW